MTEYVVLSAILVTIGSVGVLTRRNAIVVFMCVELMLNASNLALVTFAKQHGNLDGQIAAFFVMVVAAAEVSVSRVLTARGVVRKAPRDVEAVQRSIDKAQDHEGRES